MKEAKTTEIAINENRNKYRNVAARGAMLFFLLNSLNKIHAFYQFSLNAFVTVFGRGLDLAPGGRKKKKQKAPAPVAEPSAAAEAAPAAAEGDPAAAEEGAASPPAAEASAAATTERRVSESQGSQAGDEDEDEGLQLTPEALEMRLQSLLDTCTYTVFNYTRRGLFDRDKLIVLSLLTFTILLRGQVGARGREALAVGARFVHTDYPSMTCIAAADANTASLCRLLTAQSTRRCARA